jgi:hypothetical protein
MNRILVLGLLLAAVLGLAMGDADNRDKYAGYQYRSDMYRFNWYNTCRESFTLSQCQLIAGASHPGEWP